RRRAAARERGAGTNRGPSGAVARRADGVPRRREPRGRRRAHYRGASPRHGDRRRVPRRYRAGGAGDTAGAPSRAGATGGSDVSELILGNARVVTRDDVFVGSVRVRDGRIVDIDRGAALPRGAVDCDGDDLLPGLVELHTDVLEKHAFPRPGVTWPALAAVLAHDAQLATTGITTVLDSLAVGYLVDTGQRAFDPRRLAEAVRTAQLSGLVRIAHYVHLRCEVSVRGVLEMFEPFAADPLVRLVSLMDHTPGQRQFVRLDKYREYYKGKWA